ncbi:MAG: DUF4416 family protein [Endomicrobium sp.]|jgi:hypothetical protein|nr:DUF4416 family protein [Endomicrobium sp.]
MGIIKSTKKAKLFCGIIFSDMGIYEKHIDILKNEFGNIDIKSEIINFNFSNYYNKEFGSNLKRTWISFSNLILTNFITNIKKSTNLIENNSSKKNKRQINIDPGYITAANIVLATTKDYSHRIHINNGIYGEVSLIYNKGYIKLPWTYPDYLSKVASNFFLCARKIFIKQTKYY